MLSAVSAFLGMTPALLKAASTRGGVSNRAGTAALLSLFRPAASTIAVTMRFCLPAAAARGCGAPPSQCFWRSSETVDGGVDVVR